VVKTGAYKRAGKAAVRIIKGQLAMGITKNQRPKNKLKIQKQKPKFKCQEHLYWLHIAIAKDCNCFRSTIKANLFFERTMPN